ncbi:cache domain-containing protein [Sulfurospirillum sp. 1612]|uniref:cache domain-containing protein n=1 Tax=Sulfurospirillum sp. 1612 TaxID=3094835 RepID=UPI002F93CD55
MKILKEDNISTVIILSSMFIISSLVIVISYFFISKQYAILDREIKDMKTAFVNVKKNEIQREVDSVIEYIKYRRSSSHGLSEKALKQDTLELIKHIKFGEDQSNYIFVYEVLDYKGGDQFARMLVNPNRQDLIRKFISANYQDANGKTFRKIFLQDIKKQGYSFVQYLYKKPDTHEIRPKVSYFKLYKKWNWVVAAGTYLDNIDTKIAQKKANLKRKMSLDITSSIAIFLFFSLIANILAIILGKQIDRFFKQYNQEIKEKTVELEQLNKTLELRVAKEVAKRGEQERLLIEKSKFIALGEMISNIAHQWRQPLSELSAIIMNIKFRYVMGKLDSKIMDEKSKDAEVLLDYMSNTIDDFRNFFNPQRDKKHFSIKNSLENVLKIIGKTIQNQKIELAITIKEDAQILGYQNEFEQVLLNILSNAKDALSESDVENKAVEITINKMEDQATINIDDNGPGIKTRPIEKIFEPYFSTKWNANGTGIGLYMSKMIIEKNMRGKLLATNRDMGARFTIVIPIDI